MRSFLLAMLFFFCFKTLCFAQQPDDMILAGSVIDNGTLMPVPNFPVMISADSLLPALNTYVITDAAGNFHLLVPNGSLAGQNIIYTLTAYGCNQNFTLQTANNSGTIDSTFSNLNVCVGVSSACATSFQFYNNPYSPSPGLFEFFDSSSVNNHVFWSWDFGNGNVLEGNNADTVSFILSPPGIHWVCLTTINTEGCIYTHCDSVVSGALGPCNTNVSVVTDTSNLTAVFTIEILPGSGNQMSSFTLYFGDGDSLQLNSNLSPLNLIHQYDSLLNYNATVSVINAAGCANYTLAGVNFASNSCVADFFSTQVSSPPGSVYFTNTSTPGAVLYTWDFGDSSPTDTTTSPLHLYQTSGTYNVCLTANYPNGCTDTYCSITNVSFTPACLAQFTWFANTQAGPNGIQLQNLSTTPFGGTFSFNAGDGSPTFILPTQTYNYNFPAPGIYYSCLTINGPNCTASYCDSIIILASGCTANLFASQINGYTATFNSTFNPFSTGDTITVAYDYGDGNQDTLIFTANNFTNPYTFDQAGTYQVCANMESSTGCIALVCTTLTINPICDAYFNYSVNPGGPAGSYILVDSSSGPAGVSSWSWNLNGNVISGVDSLAYTFSPGQNNACLTINTIDGCSDVYCDSILYSPPSGCDVIFDSLLIPNTLPGLINLHYHYSPFIGGEILNYEYQWGDGNTDTGILGQNSSAIALHPYLPGTYQACIKITNQGGCVDSFCVQVNYQPSQLALEIRLRDIQSNNLNDMTIYIMEHDSVNNLLVSIDTSQLNDNLDVYYKILPFGNYLVKGILDPGNPLAENYLPTYFGDQLYWNSGVLINPLGVMTNLNSNYFPVNIDMATGIVPAGPGSIHGLIHEGIGETTGPVLEGIDVLLLSYLGVAIAHTKTDAAGNYSFNNLPFGVYFVFPELINHTTYPVQVNLNIAQPVADNTNLGVEAQIIQSMVDFSSQEFSLAPNPARDVITLHLPGLNEFSKIELYSADGKLLLEKAIDNSKKDWLIDISFLKEGFYFMKLGDRVEKFIISR